MSSPPPTTAAPHHRLRASAEATTAISRQHSDRPALQTRDQFVGQRLLDRLGGAHDAHHAGGETEKETEEEAPVARSRSSDRGAARLPRRCTIEMTNASPTLPSVPNERIVSAVECLSDSGIISSSLLWGAFAASPGPHAASTWKSGNFGGGVAGLGGGAGVSHSAAACFSGLRLLAQVEAAHRQEGHDQGKTTRYNSRGSATQPSE